MPFLSSVRTAASVAFVAIYLSACGTGSDEAQAPGVEARSPAGAQAPPSGMVTPSGRAGLIIALHGKGQSAASVSDPATPLGQFSKIAARNNFAFVAPQATNGSWGDCLVGVGRSEANDELRILNILDQAASNMPQGAPVYIVGFSGGGGMVARMIRHHSGRFTAAGIISGSLPLDDIDRCSVSGGPPPPLMMIHGTADVFVPYERDSLVGLLPSPFRGGVETFEFFAREAGLQHSASQWLPLSPAYTLPGSRVECVKRADSHSGRAVALCTIPGGGHLEPSIAAPYGPSAALLGKQDTTVEGAELLWDFFTSARH